MISFPLTLEPASGLPQQPLHGRREVLGHSDRARCTLVAFGDHSEGDIIPNPGDQFVGSGLGHQWKAVSREMVAG